MKKLLIILFWIVGISLNATTYYVSTTGNNGNPGTIDSPFATIHYAVDHIAVAGDIIIVRDGIYTEDVNISRDGTAVNRITIKAENKWGAKIINADYDYIFVNSGDYISIEDFEIYANPAITYTSAGILTYGAYGIISGNKIHDLLCENGPSQGGGGITVVTAAAHHNIVRDNIVYNVGWSYDYPLGDHGIYIASNYCEVYNNLVYNIIGWGLHQYHNPCDHNKYYNNTVFKCHAGGMLIAGSDGGTADYCEIRNNIFVDITNEYNSSHGAIGTWGDIGYNNVYTNNLLYNCTRNYSFYTSGTSVNAVLADPQFRDYQIDGSGDYELKSTSPAIDAGIDVGLAYNGVAPDIGYIEYVAEFPAVEPVVVITTSVFVGTTTATSGGNVTYDGGGTVSARGVCWSTSVDPTTTDSHTHNGTGAGAFVSLMTPLLPATTYHVRAYATNETGTGYGTDIEFATTSDSGLSGDPVFSNGKILMNGDKIIIK